MRKKKQKQKKIKIIKLKKKKMSPENVVIRRYAVTPENCLNVTSAVKGFHKIFRSIVKDECKVYFLILYNFMIVN